VPVEKARAALLAEIAALAAEPVSERELTTAKNQVLAAKLHERERAEGKAEAIGLAAVLQGDANRVNTDLAAVQGVTAQQLQSMARDIFTDANRLMIEYLPAAMRIKPKSKK
jgi:zinc protease